MGVRKSKNSRIRAIWRGMLRRCHNPKYGQFKDYGGRGIRVCSEWMTYEVFENWALENGYSDSLTIERDEVNEGYSPSNCRWIPKSEQVRNSRVARRISFDGKIMTANEWSKKTGIKHSTILSRIYRHGWSAEKALTTPARKKKESRRSL